jgi:hypothetical protein
VFREARSILSRRLPTTFCIALRASPGESATKVWLLDWLLNDEVVGTSIMLILREVF